MMIILTVEGLKFRYFQGYNVFLAKNLKKPWKKPGFSIDP